LYSLKDNEKGRRYSFCDEVDLVLPWFRCAGEDWVRARALGVDVKTGEGARICVNDAEDVRLRCTGVVEVGCVKADTGDGERTAL